MIFVVGIVAFFFGLRHCAGCFFCVWSACLPVCLSACLPVCLSAIGVIYSVPGEDSPDVDWIVWKNFNIHGISYAVNQICLIFTGMIFTGMNLQENRVNQDRPDPCAHHGNFTIVGVDSNHDMVYEKERLWISLLPPRTSAVYESTELFDLSHLSGNSYDLYRMS